MGPNETYSIELKPRQHEWLTAMAKKFDLPDASKALRCLINYAQEQNDEATIFDEIRCDDC